MLRISRWLPMLVATMAIGCLYPDLKMATSTGGAGGTTLVGSGGSGGAVVCAALSPTSLCQNLIAAASGDACEICISNQCCAQETACLNDKNCGTNGSGSFADALAKCRATCCKEACGGQGGSSGNAGGTNNAGGAHSTGGVTGSGGATGAVDAPAAVDTSRAVDAPAIVDAPRALDQSAAVDAPRAVDLHGEAGGDASNTVGDAIGSCNGISCPGSCCNGNVCAATQSPSMCGIGGAQCGACGPTGSTVAFSNGKAAGAMTGFAWVSLGAQDTVTNPTCQGQAITADTYCLGQVSWNSTNALCVTGSIPAVAATNPDYTNNWGILIGVNSTINQSGTLGNFGQTLGQSFTSIAITVTTGSPLTGLRVQVHRKGDDVGTNYCAAMTSGTAIPFVAFNTKCWDFPPDGTALTAADVPNIDQISVDVPSGPAGITVTNLCIAGITFATGALSACAPTPTGGGCMTASYLYCGAACCASTLPYYCSLTNGCFATEAAALAACGNTACSTCVAQPSCTPSLGGTCTQAGYLYCSGTVCCPSTSPYYCPVTGKCYTTAAAAAAVCGSTACSACGT